ncbi:MAG: hypothetical protein KDC80_00350 [Saprospiraceae bacterium]|nr:hypothetical protein [Saprospiraceae bacterium]
MKDKITANPSYSGFEHAHDTYNGISCASDGKIYYILCSDQVDIAGRMFCIDPETLAITFLGDLNQMCGEEQAGLVVQGKSHVEFYEKNKKLYFATHVGYYEMIDEMERLPVHIPKNLGPYPGGHFLAFDLHTGETADFGIMCKNEGILSMTMDKDRDQLYGISWPTGYFIHFDINHNKTVLLDPISEKGEAGQLGEDYRVLCRSMFVDPDTGYVYFSTSEGDIFYYDPKTQEIKRRSDVHLRLDYFGTYDVTQPGSMGFNWRKIHWHPQEKVAYGIHGNSGYLFRFDPRKSHIELIERITSSPSRTYGMYDQFSYGYLGFHLDAVKNRIHYLTGGPIFENGKIIGGENIPRGGAKGPENLHLITYDLNENRYTDHGPIFYPDGSRPSFVNSIALDKHGNIYSLARRNHEGKEIADLIRISAVGS